MKGRRISFDDLRPRERTRLRVRWYEAYRGFGRANTLVEELARYLRQHDQTDTVCGIRVEKRARGEFYFFLTLETDHAGHVPPETREVLNACPHLKSRVDDEPLNLEDISRFATGELKTSALGQSLPYRQLALEHAPDPFAPDDPETTPGTEDRAEQLLWYLSSVGSGSWNAFAAACKRLGFTHPRAASQLARSFRVLGHMETTRDGQRWSIAPAAVVRSSCSNGAVSTFAAGYRPPAAVGTRTTQRRAPDRLGDPKCMSEGCTEVDHPAITLVNSLPDAHEFMRGLPEVGGVSQTAQQFARFDGTEFKPGPFRHERGLYEVRSSGGRETTLLFDGDVWRQGDWYGLRFLALQQAGLLLPAKFDAETWTLAIPSGQRPPEVYERALVLSGGFAPACDHAWCTYRSVEPEVASKAANRLGLDLMTINE